jgi:hypothetical protein
MKSKTGQNAEMFKIEISCALDVKCALLEKLIDIFGNANETGELDKWVDKVKQEFLIKQLGCSEAVANKYIKAALDRI